MDSNAIHADGSAIAFAYTQTSSGWKDVSSNFIPSTPLATDDPKAEPIHVYVGPLSGQPTDDIALLNDARPLIGDTPIDQYRKFGHIFINDTSRFVEQPDFAPPVAFARQDKQDLGVRFVDLHGTGLPDLVFSRLKMVDGKAVLMAGAYRNTGHGWVPEPGLCTITAFDISNANPTKPGGLCPPIPFAGDDIAGNPVQFLDLDGDGYLDLIYSYKNKAGVTVTQIYFNVDDGHGGRRWSEQSSDPSNQKRYDLPARVLPLSSFGIGDMGVRFAKFDANRLGILQSFRAAGSVVCKGRQCALQPGPTKTSAFSFDGNGWVDRSDRFAPPVPFVTQSDSPTGPSHDLMVQIVDVRGGGLPAIVASFTDPITKTATSPGAKVNKVWLNTEAGWDASSGITLPYDLDAIYWEPKSLVQFADVNGDGLPDIVMTKGSCLDCSRTWVNTGRGWIEDPNWRVPSEAISNKDGDPGFRLVDIKGDGYLDILWMRQKDDGSFEQGLRLNNGHDWSTKAPDNVVPKQLAFVSKDGVDQGVRLLSVSGKGLTDIVQSFEGRIQTILLNRSRRTDVLDTITDGYGLQTRVYYETLLEVDGADPASGIKEGGPLGWRTYEREAANAYPKVASIPTTYVVRKAVVDEGNGHPSAVDYRYGRYRVDGAALRSLGFGWRETLNEVSSVLNRSEMIQDARAPPRVSRDATCIVRQDILKGPSVNRAETNSATGPFPNDLCPGGDTTAFTWGYKISENSTCWTITEGDSSGHISEINLPSTPDCRTDSKSSPLTGYIIRQNAISRSRSRTFEVDGRLVSLTTDTFTYDTAGSILKRSGDVLNTTSVMADGTSIETENEYTDDWSRWFLGRLTKTTVTKRGDVIDQAGPLRKSETRCSRFEYDRETGLLTAQEVNCGNSRSVTTRFIRDPLGNIVSKITLAAGEQPQTTRLEYDEFGRFEVANTDALGHRSTVRRDPASGQPRSVTDPNNLTATMEYDAFGRLRKQTDPSGVTSISELFAAVPGVLPKVGSAADITDGLTTSVNYAIKTQTGALPPAWTLFDVKGRPIRKVTRGFSANPEKVRFVFQDTDYDGLGRIRRSSLPRFADEPPKWAINQYDDLGRVCASTAINGLRTETIFEGLPGGGARVIVSVDPKKQLTDLEVGDGGKKLLACGQISDPSLYSAEGLDQRSYSTINMRKEIVEASDAVGRITYEYDAGGRLERMRGPTGAVTLNSYDDLGNKVVVSDPDLGVWRYDYDPFGRVVRQVDAKGQKSTIEYDVAGRPVRRVLNDATTSWQYDVAAHGIGKVASITDSNGYRESYFYDRYGRVVSDAVLIDGEQFTTSTEYDDLGRVAKLTYPSGLIVANSYDAQGFFTKVTDGLSGKLYWTVDDIDALGRVAKEDFGNGVTTVKRFHPEDERLSQIEISGRSGVHVLDLTLQYDLVGNLRARRESVERRNERFDYDAINRLVGQVSVQSGRSEYRYDAAGRITFKSGIGDYRYGTQGRSSDDKYSTPFHAVMAVNYGESERNYKYDLNGNMISSRAGHFDYTADNHVRLMYLDEQKWSRFDYGPSGDRFRQFLREGNISEETLYISLSEKVIDYSPYLNFDMGHPERFSGFERFTRSRSYLVNSSGVFAVVETDDTRSNTQFFDPLRPSTQWYGKLTSTETWYLHADQLGSVVRITDQDGRLRKSYWYDPWGARSERSDNRTGAGETQQLGVSWKRGFTGHEHLDTFSLIHMNGRVYNPILAVFTSVDPVNQMTLDTQTGNGYAYARNNPLRYVDPSGLDFLGIGHAIHEVGKAIGGAATSAWHGITHFGGEAGKWFAENWRVVVVIAVVIVVEVVTLGAATPAVGALGGAILAGMAAGAAGGALGAALYGGSPDEILTGAFKGAIIGGISGAVGYGLGQYFGPVDEMTTTSRIESVAAHGVVGGARSSVTGGDFAGGFIAGAATQAATAFGPDTRIETLNVARAAIVGGTTSAISGDKFANGAIMAALQYEFVEQFTPRSGRVLSYGEKELYGGYFSDDTLNEVRVHEGIVPFWLSSDAEAVTVGNDVYIRPDAPDLQTSRGEAELLGHELTHAEQFRNGMTIIDYLSEAAKNGAGPENKYEAPAYSAGPKFGAAFCLTYERASGCPNVP